MDALTSYDDWMRTGRLSPYVTERKSAGDTLTLFEAAQPAGDMSDPAMSSLVLVQPLSRNIKLCADFGGGRTRKSMGRGDFALVPPGFATEIEVYMPHRIRAFGFESSHFREVMEDARPGRDAFDFGRLHEGRFVLPQLCGLLDRMWADAADRGGGRLLAESMALQVLALLAQAAEGAAVQARGGLAPWAERRVRDFMHDHLARDTSLSELAALVGLSPFHFTRMFKQSAGASPYVYLRRLRAERACVLLATTDLPVIEIALAVGYDTPQAFARMFRAEAGTSPSQWRRAHGGMTTA